MKNSRCVLRNLAVLAGMDCAATLGGKLFAALGVPETNIVVLYLFAVLLVARLTQGYRYGILASVTSLLCFNFYFTAPYHTFAVNDPSYLITFFVMLVTSLLTSAMTTKEKILTRQANERGEESRILYMLSSRLSDAADTEQVLGVALDSVSKLLQADAGCVYLGGQGQPISLQQVGGQIIHRRVEDAGELRARFTDLRTEYLAGEEGFSYPICDQDRLMAVLTVAPKVSRQELADKSRLLHVVLENVAMALGRIEVTEARIRDRENMERERERANMLRAISHDLRTPLSGIMGSSEMLMDMTDKDDRRQPLLRGIYQDADWLREMVENILSLTRLQDGRLSVHKEPQAIEEIIGSAVTRLERSWPDREIQVETPEEFRLVPMDAGLIQQVLTNLLENALKHTTPGEEVRLCARYTGTDLEVTVQDEGEGIAPQDLPHLFQLFYTATCRSTDARRGIGLGLTICQTVVRAHGGTITARNRTDRQGAEFTFTLPLQGENHHVSGTDSCD
ncbi:sensor histidine kinase [Gemmiger sp.]|uniref:sensor histidine kinase n=1 Tax=Gemmiger sp. TaxID=2049027 RepID=UPI003F0793B1